MFRKFENRGEGVQPKGREKAPVPKDLVSEARSSELGTLTSGPRFRESLEENEEEEMRVRTQGRKQELADTSLWGGDPAETYEERHSISESDEVGEKDDNDEEIIAADEGWESKGDEIQGQIDKQTGRVNLSVQRVLGKERKGIPPRLRYEKRPVQSPEYKTVKAKMRPPRRERKEDEGQQLAA